MNCTDDDFVYPARNYMFKVKNENTRTVLNMFKLNYKESRTTSLKSLLLTLTIFNTLL